MILSSPPSQKTKQHAVDVHRQVATWNAELSTEIESWEIRIYLSLCYNILKFWSVSFPHLVKREDTQNSILSLFQTRHQVFLKTYFEIQFFHQTNREGDDDEKSFVKCQSSPSIIRSGSIYGCVLLESRISHSE